MALNSFMHPRNIYKNAPDFSILAKKYSEFLSIVKTDTCGKVTIDFKDPKSLRILTRCLLKSDFNVDIDIPEDRLVPTLPLRLNYVLWIEDLLVSVEKNSNICGLDIGTGACAIYPVLGCVKNKWRMIGTECDQKSMEIAQQNLDKNNLQNLIKLFKNSTSTILSGVLDSGPDQMFDFCMCNPPFYSSLQELCESRDVTRHPPKNGFTGSPQELITEGGELQFCKKLIAESKTYRSRITIFTTMIGHKYNLKELMRELFTDGIKFTHTEFCQGRVTRWGLAWTYQDYDLYRLVPPREKSRRKTSPISFLLPQLENTTYNLETCTEKITSIINNLRIHFKILNKRGNEVSIHLRAIENTWSHQRRKRRLLKMMEANDTKKNKMSSDSNTVTNSGISSELDIDTSYNNNEDCKLSPNNSSKNLIVEAFLRVLKKDKDILFQAEYLNGSGGKEGLHQIVQYIKNNWK